MVITSSTILRETTKDILRNVMFLTLCLNLFFFSTVDFAPGNRLARSKIQARECGGWQEIGGC